ncbi:hypothetical protein K490DRAFT_63856 [Saccharata proteae CBS 121410]|uniref:Pentapeptide repeat-containing protein n=1 Tax=Saccharata proteae CBS 121410 TaxID=1314787 RepID=A0A6A5YCT9_9PEZI|nr:hypothetical protein K490DRAFT_63856 [Saccharata proteae CBS 121410]
MPRPKRDWAAEASRAEQGWLTTTTPLPTDYLPQKDEILEAAPGQLSLFFQALKGAFMAALAAEGQRLGDFPVDLREALLKCNNSADGFDTVLVKSSSYGLNLLPDLEKAVRQVAAWMDGRPVKIKTGSRLMPINMEVPTYVENAYVPLKAAICFKPSRQDFEFNQFRFRFSTVHITALNHGCVNVTSSELEEVKFTRCEFIAVSFQGTECHNVRFEDCKLADVDFINCAFSGTSFTGLRLTDCRFENVQFGNSEVHDLQLMDSNLSDVTVSRTMLGGLRTDSLRWESVTLEDTVFWDNVERDGHRAKDVQATGCWFSTEGIRWVDYVRENS